MNLLSLERRRNSNKKIFRTTPAICFPGLDYETNMKKLNMKLSWGAAVVGTVHIPNHTDQITDWALSKVLWEECIFWQLLPSVAILRKHNNIKVLGVPLPQLHFQNMFTCIINRECHLLAVSMYSHFGRNICKREGPRFKRALSDR